MWDENGNRILHLTSAGIDTGVYDAQDKLLLYGCSKYLYDKNGFMNNKIVGSDTTGYTFDSYGNLRSISLPSGERIEYIIDGKGRRIGKKLNGIVVKKWLYYKQTCIAELDSVNNIVVRFFGNCMYKNGNTYQLITDHLGSVRLVVDVNSGEIAQQIDYDEFGNVIYDSNPGFQPFGFTRGMYESNCGLVFLGVRVYDPKIGRWLSPDPIRFAASGTNLYNYVLSDPINSNDPTGLDANTVTYAEVRQWANVSSTNYNPAPGLADAKASIAAACERSVGGCGEDQPGSAAAPGDQHAWQNIVNATGGTDLSGGGNFMCVGSQGCWFVHSCRNSQGNMVERTCNLAPSGNVTLRGHTIYFYNDPLLGNCSDQ